MMGTILLILLILMLLGGLPTWPHSRNWGYGPSGIIGTILIVYSPYARQSLGSHIF